MPVSTSPVPSAFLSEEAYLEKERQEESKSEFIRGDVYAFPLQPADHHATVASVMTTVYNYIRGSVYLCYANQLRIYNPHYPFYLYPDFTVALKEHQPLELYDDALLHPLIIVEVYSSATESFDRGTKFKLYRSIQSLQNYVLISSMEALAEVYTRSGDSWILTTSKGLDSHLHISAVNYDLQLKDVYAQVDLEK